MKIDVTYIAGAFGRQTQAYAEYRVFSSLAYFSDIVRKATVSLTPAISGHSVVGSVLISLDHGLPVRVTARGRHAYDAINRVAHRIAPALRRHVRVALSS